MQDLEVGQGADVRRYDSSEMVELELKGDECRPIGKEGWNYLTSELVAR